MLQVSKYLPTILFVTEIKYIFYENEHVIRYNVPQLEKLNDRIRIMVGNKFTRANRSEGDWNYPAFDKTADVVPRHYYLGIKYWI